MELKPGLRLKSAVCDTEVVVVRPAPGDVALECGGQPMVAATAAKPEGLALSPDHSGGTQMGKRYADDALGLEVLCVKPGAGSLSVGGEVLGLKDAKKLPASD